MSASPSAVVLNNRIHLFHQGSDHDGQLWRNIWDGNSWNGDERMTGAVLSCAPNAVVREDSIYVFFQGAGRDGRLYFTIIGEHQAPVPPIWCNPVADMVDSPAAVVVDGGIQVYRRRSDDLIGCTRLNVGGVSPDTRIEPDPMCPIESAPAAILADG
jgi:hypothetical protein